LTFPRIVIVGSLLFFCSIGIVKLIKPAENEIPEGTITHTSVINEIPSLTIPAAVSSEPTAEEDSFPSANRVDELFKPDAKILPIVETISYSTKVPWLSGRSAWIADYASYYSTSKHFIARSLNKKPDYMTRRVILGNRFNVFKKDRNFQFYLLVDASVCKMGFYYVDLDTNERVLIKTYKVGLGKKAETPSYCLTPLGKYALGSKTAIYNKDSKGFYQKKQVNMLTIFGTRWIPFDQIISSDLKSCKGLGIQGAPWEYSSDSKEFTENCESIGNYGSDGCIRLLKEDVEELFSIIITKPTIIEVVKHFKDARLPGMEVVSPKR
jgi:hypothetical protein